MAVSGRRMSYSQEPVEFPDQRLAYPAQIAVQVLLREIIDHVTLSLPRSAGAGLLMAGNAPGTRRRPKH